MINKTIEKGRLDLEEKVYQNEISIEKKLKEANEGREKLEKAINKKIDEGLQEVNEKIDGVESTLENDITEAKDDLE